MTEHRCARKHQRHGHVWALHWPVLQFLGGLVATIFLDIIHISIFYPRHELTGTGHFGAGMAILSLLLKPFSCCLVYHMYRERGGEFQLHAGKATPPASPRLPTSPLSPPCLTHSPCPSELTLHQVTRAQGAGAGLA